MLTMTMKTMERYQSWRSRRKAEQRLRGLSDRTLQDIGLRRASIGAKVTEIYAGGSRADARY